MSTDDHDPPPTEPETPPASHEHHGVVETIREEIEEVASHVPQPVRWTVGKIVRLVALGLVGLLVLLVVSVVLYLGNRTELVAREVALLLNQALAQRSDVVLDLRDLRGNPFTGFRAVNPVVRFRADGVELLSARELEARYPLWTLLRGGRGPVILTLREPSIRLLKDANGRLRVPVWRAAPRRGSARGLDVILRIEKGRLLAPAPIGEVTGIGLDAVVATGTGTHVTVRRLSWDRGPWDSRLEALTGTVHAGRDSVQVVLRELRTGDVTMRARAAWAAGGKAPERIVHAEIDRVRWGWLAKVFDNRTFDVSGQGAAVLDARGSKRWEGVFRSKLDWDSTLVDARGRLHWDGAALLIDSLAGTTRAGDVSAGIVRWAKPGWEVSGQARGADPANWDALQLHGWPAGDLNGWFRYAVDTRVKGRQNSRLDAVLTGSEWTGWVVDSARVRVDFAAVANDSFEVVGWRRGGRFDLDARIEPWGWGGPYAVTDFPLDEWPDGRASGLRGTLTRGEGRVESRAGGLFVTGDLDGGATTWSAAQFARWRLSEVKGRLLPTPELTAQALATDGFFTGIHVDSARSAIQLGDQNVTFPDLQAMAGDTTFTGTGNAAWTGARWSMTMSAARVQSSQLAWLAEPPVRLGGDADGVVFDRLVADDADAHIEASGRWASPGGFYDFSARGSRVDLSRIGFPPEWGLGGFASGELVVTGRSGDPRFRFRGGCETPRFDGHGADSMSVALAGRPSRLDVEDFRYRLGAGEANGQGVFDRIEQPWPDSLTGTAVFRWLSGARAWDGTLEARSLPVDRLTHVSPRADGWSGALGGRVTVSGSPRAPRFDASAAVSGLAWRDYRSERFAVRARYADGLLEIPDASLVMRGVESTASGRLPLKLAMDAAPVLPDEPMAWTFRVPTGDLQLLPLLVPQIQSARGQFDLEGRMEGTVRHPRLSGTGRVRDGVVRPAGRQEVLEGLHADFRFSEARIVLDSLSARQGKEGRVRSRGVVNLEGLGLQGYRFDLDMRDFAASEPGLYAMLFDGDFVVTDGPRVFGQRLPQVTGDVRLTKGVVEFDFANQSEVQKIAAQTQPLYWTYRIHMEAKNNLRWRPPDGDIEFDANLDLEQTADSLLVYGEMHSLRGTYYFLGNRFNVTRADLTFDNQKGVNPQLDIAAEAKVRSASSRTSVNTAGAGTDAPETIRATITGWADQPIIGLEAMEHPDDWDQRRILEALTYGLTSNPDQLQLQSVADNILTQQLNNQLSRELSDFFGGAIAEWELQRESGGLFRGEGDIFVQAGTQLTPALAVRYRQRLWNAPDAAGLGTANPLERDVEAEYRLSRFIFLTTEVKQHRYSNGSNQSGQGAPEVNVNLKARWEY